MPARPPWVVAVAALCAVLAALSAASLVLRDDDPLESSPVTGGWFDHAVHVEAVGCGPVAHVGSGTWIDSERVLVAAHVVAGAERVAVRAVGVGGAGAIDPPAPSDAAMEMVVVALDPVTDLALLEPARLESALPEPAPVSAGPPAGARVPLEWASADPGDRLRFVGIGDPPANPSGARVVRTVTIRMATPEGSGTRPRRGLEIAATVVEGDSGALLVDEAGRAVGIVFASSRTHDDRAWATDAVEIRRFVDSAEAGRDASRCW